MLQIAKLTPAGGKEMMGQENDLCGCLVLRHGWLIGLSGRKIMSNTLMGYQRLL